MMQASEREISRAVVNELVGFHRLKKLSYFVNLEGAKRTRQQQISAKRHGMRAGRPDIEIFLPNGKTVLIELKTLKNGRLSPAQKETHEELSQLNHDVRTIYAPDIESAIDSIHKILCEYGVTL